MALKTLDTEEAFIKVKFSECKNAVEVTLYYIE